MVWERDEVKERNLERKKGMIQILEACLSRLRHRDVTRDDTKLTLRYVIEK